MMNSNIKTAGIKKNTQNIWARMVRRLKKDMVAWILIAPCLIFFIIFLWQPMISGIRMSFYETNGFETVKFIGFDNYKDVISDSLFITALKNTWKYALWSVLIGLFLPVITSIFVNEMVHLKGFFRFSIYFPCIVPGVVTSVMWLIMFQPDANGLLNMIFQSFGLPASQFLQNAKLTIPLIVVTMTWGGFGSTMILYLASLQSVNLDLYEAVSLDGGGFWKKLWHITLPHMSGLIRMLFIMQLINVFQVFQQPLTMTSGGPNNASISLAMLSYNYAYKYFQIGRSTSVSVITSIMLILFTIIYLRIKGKETE